MSCFYPEEMGGGESCGSFPRKTHASVWYAVSGELAAISAYTACTQDTLGGCWSVLPALGTVPTLLNI